MDWKVTPIWKDETVFIIAGGPSVADEDLSLLEGRKVIVVNSSYTVYPDADYLIFADARWWNVHKNKVAKQFRGQVVGVSRHINDPSLLRLGRVRPSASPICMDPSKVAIERTTLQSAINLSVHLGAGRIVLIGADMKRDENGNTHHHEPHPWKNKDGNKTWDLQMKQLEDIVAPLNKLGVEVINSSMVSRIDWWKKIPLLITHRLGNRRRTPMGTSDSREYDMLVRRKFKPYSLGHRMMYTLPITTELGGNKHRIFEAGFGIGWGLEQMIKAGVIESYVGCEPNKDSYNYVAKTYKGANLTLLNEPFSPELAKKHAGGFDYAFCIEVIEHVPGEKHVEFLRGLKGIAPVVFFSTPDIRKAPKEGVRTTEEWVDLLKEAGFKMVSVHDREWTHLYTCR